MARVDRLLPVVGAVLRAGLLVLPASAQAGGAGEEGHAAFAIKPVSAGRDVKARLWGVVSVAKLAPDLSIKCEDSASRYPWKIGIVSTVFWVGEIGCGPANTRSAWDPNWEGTYGGVDDPVRRNGFEPAGFRPLQNPFYVALPYCDMQTGRLKPEAAKMVPWFIEAFCGPDQSVCKGRWLEIRHGLKACYAQWQDVGPFHTDSAGYVFGDEQPSPNLNHGAGIDVSPAVRDYLGLGRLDLVDWRFVEQADVPAGPWSRYDGPQIVERSR
jgi:hypothetical protein